MIKLIINLRIRMKQKLLLWLIGLLISLNGLSQSPFYNPSFEGNYVGVAAPYWQDCVESRSTTNLQPGYDQVNLFPNEGKTYLGMVVRGCLGQTCHESVWQRLKYPLSKDSCYSFNIHLAYEPDEYAGYNDQAILRIWGGNNECKKEELLWTSPQKINIYWIPYLVDLQPSENYEYIILEAYYRDLNSLRQGNILMDNIKDFKAVPKNYRLDLGKDTTLCRDKDLWLDINFPNNYPIPQIRWNTGATAPRLLVEQAGKYWVSVNYGCTIQTDTIEIQHEACVFIPNVITPNQDGKNELWELSGIKRGEWQVQIYDRLGTLVYQTEDYQNDWGGNNLPTGRYFYQIRNRETKESYKGWVEVIK
jgi:gliding motility-associated-like protein